jgi:hypothetical protein
MKRFLLIFLGILFYMAAWALAILPLALLFDHREAGLIVGLAFGVLLLSTLGLVPFMQWLSGRVFRWRGEGPALSAAALRERLKQINDWDVPVIVLERNGRLVVTWRYADARWWEILAKAGLARVYELHIKLDERRKVATLIDVQKSVQWRAGPSGVRLRGGFFRGIDLRYERARAWGISEAFRPGSIYDYRFVTSEIKDPVTNTILDSGWDVRFGLW